MHYSVIETVIIVTKLHTHSHNKCRIDMNLCEVKYNHTQINIALC